MMPYTAMEEPRDAERHIWIEFGEQKNVGHDELANVGDRVPPKKTYGKQDGPARFQGQRSIGKLRDGERPHAPLFPSRHACI